MSPPHTGKPPRSGRSSGLGNTRPLPSAGAPPPPGTSPPGTSPPGNLPLGGESCRLGYPMSSLSTGTSLPSGISPSGKSPLGGVPPRQVHPNSSPSTGTSQQQPRPEKRDRTTSNGSQTESGKRAKTAESALDPESMDLREERPPKHRPTSFGHLKRSPKMFCAIQIDDNEVMGNPFMAPKDWNVKVLLEPGTLGVPSIEFDFRYGKDEAKTTEYKGSFQVTWEPGVKIEGKWMIEELEMMPAIPSGRGLDPWVQPYLPRHRGAKAPDDGIDPEECLQRLTYPAAIAELYGKCAKKSEFMTRNLIFAMFKSNVHRISELNREWVNTLADDARQAPLANMETMLKGEEPSYMVKMWFLNRIIDPITFHGQCLGPLIDAVTDHTPPLHQYLDGDDQPFISYQLPTIDAIGNGMYHQYPKYTDANGQRVDDRSAPPTYLSQPQSLRWDSIKKFHVTSGVPVVRTMQYNDDLHARIKRDWHHVFLQRMPEFKPVKKGLVPDLTWKHTFRAGIRLTRDPKTGLKDAVPPVNSKVNIEFRNSYGRQGEHERVKEEVCFGCVSSYGGRAWLEKTKTDFCVVLTKPRALTELKIFNRSVDRSDEKLPLAKVKIVVNHEASIREKKALDKLCDEEYMPELLNPVRLAFWSEPSKSPEHIDLTVGPANNRSNANKKMYEDLMKRLEQKRPMNKTQFQTLNAASQMKSRIVTVQGPPGAGKTRTLKDKVIALAKIGHKVLVVAASDAAVDTDAKAVWAGLDDEERKTIKCLRLESDGAEKAQRLSRRNYGKHTGEEGEQDKIPEYHAPKEAVDNPAIRNALDKLCLDFEINRAHAEWATADYEDVNEALKNTERYEEMKQSSIPVGMTFDHHVWNVTQADEKEADRRFKETMSNISKEELEGQVRDDEISIAMFDESRQYRQVIADYISKDGRVSKVERTVLENASDHMFERVLAGMNIVLTTASNCGGELLGGANSFEPTVIFCDEAGQISIPSLCVPLTTFTKWEGLFLFGDVQQLKPSAFSGQFNEFVHDAMVSPLALLAMKGVEPILLDEQYRMCPACSAFPRMQFYDGKGLKDSVEVKRDNAIREAVREVSIGLGVVGGNGEGSEYFVTNVARGCSRVEINGTSLVNYANADVVVDIIDRLILTKVVKASVIKVLTYYQGQRRLLRQLINSRPWPRDVKNAIEIATVDSFQARESAVVIVDMVAAKDGLTKSRPGEQEIPKDAKDNGTEDYIKQGAVTNHLKDPNRLNFALTRGKDSTIVICQAALLSSTFKTRRYKQKMALSNMIGDANSRKLLVEDNRDDSHPVSVKGRADKSATKLRMEQEKQKELEIDLIANSTRRWQAVKFLHALPPVEPVKYYRTPTGHTTRPIGDPKLAAEADAVEFMSGSEDGESGEIS